MVSDTNIILLQMTKNAKIVGDILKYIFWLGTLVLCVNLRLPAVSLLHGRI